MKWLGVLLLIGAFLGGTAGPAVADYLENHGTIAHFGSDGCVNSRAEVSHGAWGGGYWKTDTEVEQDDYWGFNCTTPLVRPVGYVAAHVQGWRYSAGS